MNTPATKTFPLCRVTKTGKFSGYRGPISVLIDRQARNANAGPGIAWFIKVEHCDLDSDDDVRHLYACEATGGETQALRLAASAVRELAGYAPAFEIHAV